MLMWPLKFLSIPGSNGDYIYLLNYVDILTFLERKFVFQAVYQKFSTFAIGIV